MTFEIEANGRPHIVSVERVAAGDRYRVTLDGRSRVVDAVRVSPDRLSLIFSDAGHASVETGFADGLSVGELTVHLDSGTVTTALNGRRLRRGAATASSAGEQRIVAPMPGRILRVLAAPGDMVAARQPVIVVEAMKMENELSCLRPGRVKEVGVTVGESVEAGRLLAIVE
jgi:biotin carboxyl carrier protein